MREEPETEQQMPQMPRTRRAFLRVAGQVLAVGAVASVAGAAGCVRVQDRRGPLIGARPWRVVATTGMVADLARFVGGEDVSVSSMMGPGVDPHLYKAGVRDTSLLGEADVIFYSGLHLEGKMAEVFEHMGERRRVAAVSEHFPPEKLHTEEGGAVDPHVWFDVRLWMLGAQ